MVEPFSLGIRLLPDRPGLLDHRVLRIRHEQDGRQHEHRHDGDRGRTSGEARPEEVGPHDAERAEGVAPLLADEPPLLRLLVTGGGARFEGCQLVVGGGSGSRGDGDRQRERTRDAVTKASLPVQRDRRFCDRRPGTDRRGREGHQAKERQGGADGGSSLERDEPRQRPEAELGERDRGGHDPSPTHDPAQPETPPMRSQAGSNPLELGVQRAGQHQPRVHRQVEVGGSCRRGRGGAAPPERGASGAPGRRVIPPTPPARERRRNAGRRGRQRRVGVTSWTAAAVNPTARSTRVRALRGQYRSRWIVSTSPATTSSTTMPGLPGKAGAGAIITPPLSMASAPEDRLVRRDEDRRGAGDLVDDRAPSAGVALRAARHVRLGDERIEIEEGLGRALREDVAAARWRA